MSIDGLHRFVVKKLSREERLGRPPGVEGSPAIQEGEGVGWWQHLP